MRAGEVLAPFHSNIGQSVVVVGPVTEKARQCREFRRPDREGR